MSDRQVRIIISASVESALRGMRDVEGGLGRVSHAGQQAERNTGGFGDKLKSAAAAAGVVTGFAAVAGAIGFVVKQGVGFQDSMNQLKAVTQSSDAQMASMSTTARDLGSDITIPGTSAADAAGAMLELAKGGLTAQQAMEATRGTLILAAAAGVSGAEAATMQAAALNTFGLEASEAGTVANTLANAANSASGEISDFSQGLAQTGTVAASLGWSLEDTTAMLGLMANAGIKGSDAGTSLKGALTYLLNPSKEAAAAQEQLGISLLGANGEMITAQEFTGQLAEAKGRMSAAEYTTAAAVAFGTDAVRTALVAGDAGTAGLDRMTDALGNASGAQDVATAKTQGVSGAFGEMMSQVEDVALTLFDKFSPAMEGALGFAGSLVTGIGDLVGWIGDLPGPVLAGAAAFGAMLLLKGPMNALFIQAVAGYQRIGIAAMAAAASVRAGAISMATFGTVAKGALAFLGGPLGIALIAGASALAFFASGSDDAAGSTADFTGAIDENTGALSENAARVLSAAAAASGGAAAYEAIGGKASDYVDALGGIPAAQERVNATIEAYKTAAKDAALASGEAGDAAGNAGTSYGGANAAIAGQADRLSKASEVTKLLASDTAALGDEQASTRLEIDGASGAISGNAAAIEAAAEKAKLLADAMKAAVENASALAGLTEGARQLDGVANAASAAARALDLFKIAQDDADGRVRSLDEATANQNKTLRALSEAYEEGTKAAEENTEAGDLNVEALKNWDVAALTATGSGSKMFDEMTNMADQYSETTEAAYSNAVATGNVAGAADVARAAATSSRDAFVALMTQHFGNADQANALADKLGILDGTKIDNKTFTTINEDAEAQRKLAAMKSLEIRNKTFGIIGNDLASGVINSIRNAFIPDKVFNIGATVSGAAGSALAGAFGATGGRVGALAGFAAGGKVPGNPPVNRRADNMLTFANGKPMMLRSKEWIINQDAAEFYGDRMMAAINDGRFPQIPGFAAGGTVSRASLAGISPRTLGDREGVSVGALRDIRDWVRGLAQDAKTGTPAMKAYAANMARVYTSQTRARGVLAGLARVYDSQVARLGDLKDRRASTIGDRNQLAGSVSGSIGGFGGGITGFSDQRVTAASVVGGLKFNAAKILAFGRNLALLRKKGLAPGLLAEIAGGGEDGMRVAATLAAATAGQIREANAYSSIAARSAAASGRLTADAVYGKAIAQQSKEIAQLSRQMIVVARSGERLAKAVERGIDIRISPAGLAAVVRQQERVLRRRGA